MYNIYTIKKTSVSIYVLKYIFTFKKQHMINFTILLFYKLDKEW